MDDLQQIKADLDQIKSMLRVLLGDKGTSRRVVNVGEADVLTEVAMVKASGGDLVQHFKDRAKRRMAEEKQRRGAG